MMNPNSKYLSERLISRLSPLRRANLKRRIRERVEMLGMMNRSPESSERYDRAVCVLGRLSALTA